MSGSVVEQVLARALVALNGATLANAEVFRGRVDNFGADEDALPAINIRRRPSSDEVTGNNVAKILLTFDLECFVQDTDDWETAADALHMQAHSVLANDAPFNLLGRGLRCTGTDAQADASDRIIGKLTASYQMQVLIRPGDLTRALS